MRPVSPVECKHRHTLMVQSHRYTGTDGNNGRDRVEVCQDCGTFFVYGDKNGVRFSVRFTLPTAELVKAAGQNARLLENVR